MSESDEIGIEQFFRRLGRGVNDGSIRKEDLAHLLADVLGLAAWSEARPSRNTGASSSITIDNNKQFWSASLHEGQRLTLDGFHVTAWVPSSPGRYHSSEAANARHIARQYWSGGEYLPLGKENMILGGVGSVRLSAKSMRGEQVHLLGGSSSGITHEGIPLAIPFDVGEPILACISEDGGILASLSGTVGVLPDIVHLNYGLHVPRRYVFVDRIHVRRKSKQAELLGTVSIAFASAYGNHDGGHSANVRERGESGLQKAWCFASFNPASEEKLRRAAQWMQEYVLRHSRISANAPPILSDFDEHACHFDLPTEFTLADVFARTIDLARVHDYERYLQFTLNIINSNVGAIAAGPQARAVGFVQPDGFAGSGNSPRHPTPPRKKGAE